MGLFIHRRKVRERQTLSNAVVDNHVVEASAQEKTAEVEKPQSSLTEEDINKLPYFSLKALASNYGIDVTDKKTKELRKELLKKLKEE